jgi:glycosyltransferase involved in cell wall biosynthesis
MGGANKVTVTVIDELARLGEDVAVATLYKSNLQRIHGQWNVDLSHVEIFNKSIPFGLERSGILAYYRLYSVILKASREFKPDQIIFFDDVIDPKNKIHGRIVLYAHLPFSLRIRYFDRRSDKLRTRIYENLFKLTPEADLILSNSSTTSKFIKAAWGRNTKIVYPPADTVNFRPLEKENSVALLARFRPYKHIEDGIEAVALSKSKPKLCILGLKGSNEYLTRLKALVKKRGIEKNTTFLVDATIEEVRKTLGQAKIFVHPCRHEPFGIAVVEAMAAGCVPIVYKDWGPWIDIVNSGKYGIGFETVNDLANKIDEVVSDETEFERLSQTAQKRAGYFSEERFRKKIEEALCAL